MSVIITIGEERKAIDDRYESWISEQVRNRRKAGESVSVRVDVGGDLNLSLVCQDSPQSGGGAPRNYTPRQLEIINLWKQNNLNSCPFDPGDLISFLKRLELIL